MVKEMITQTFAFYYSYFKDGHRVIVIDLTSQQRLSNKAL